MKLPAPAVVESSKQEDGSVALVKLDRVRAPRKIIRIPKLPKRPLLNRGIIRNHCQKSLSMGSYFIMSQLIVEDIKLNNE